MNPQTQAQIYLAEQRTCTQTDLFRSYRSFNAGACFEESRIPFGALCLLNDDTLQAGASLTVPVKQATEVMLLPVSGGLEYQIEPVTGESGPGSPVGNFLEPGQVQLLSVAAGTRYVVSNPYEAEDINFVQPWLTPASADISVNSHRITFDLSHKNALLPLFGPAGAEPDECARGRRFIGRYDGRQDDVYRIAGDPANGIYVFVLQGAFEVQNRLLHEKDGLALRAVADGLVEWEALPNDAVLLLIEVPA